MSKPTNWVEGQLGKVCSIEIGGTPSRGIPAYWDAERATQNAWVSIKDMHQRTIFDTAEQISNAGARHSNAKLQPKGTVLLSFKLTIGRVATAGVPLYTNEAIASLKPTQALTSEYLYYGLQYWDLLQDVDQAIKGATLNKEKLKWIKFVYPKSVPEQTKIAEILSTVDRAIEQTEALIAKQQRIKTGLMQDLLTRGIDEHGNLRSEQTHQFKVSPLGQIPMEWDTRRFADITPNNAPIGYGIVQPGAYDYTGAKVAGIYTINSRFQEWHMSANRIEQAYVRSRIRPGDVLLSIKGTTGRVGVVPEETTGNISRDIARIRPIKEINPHYLRCLMLSDFFQRYLGNAEVGTTRAEISIKILRDLYVIKPPAPEQDEIVNRVRSVEQSIDQNDAMCNKLYSLKNSLMQDLLTGKCRMINRPRETKELQPYEHL